MRFRRLELVAYGRFTNFELDFAQEGPDLHLIVGPNEAGKSTTRNALGDLLFGIAANTPFAFLHEYGKLRLGATLEQGDATLKVYRRKGQKNTLLDEQERPLAEQALQSFLGQADRKFFERMFSLDHISLVAGARELLDAKDDVGRLLFQASGGLLKLGELARQLETDADKIWAARRSKDRDYYKAYDKYQEHSLALVDQAVSVKQYSEAVARLEQAKDTARQRSEEQALALELGAKLERIKRLVPALGRRRQYGEERRALGEVVMLPENADAQLQEAKVQLARSDDERLRLSEALLAARRKLEGATPNQELLARAAEIRALDSRRHELRPYPDDLAKRRAEVAWLLTEAGRYARDLGWPNCSREELERRLPSALDAQRLKQQLTFHQRHATALEGARQALQRRRNEIADLSKDRRPAEDAGAPNGLRLTLEEARRLGDIESRRGELKIPADLSKNHLRAAFAQLSPWQGDLSALRALAPPSDHELEGLEQRFDRNNNERRELANERARDENRRALLELQLAQIERDFAPVTRQQLTQSRTERDEHFLRLRKVVLAPPEPEANVAVLLDAQATATHRADALADRRFDAAEASAKMQQLRSGLEEQEQQLRASAERLELLDSELKALETEFLTHTTGLGLEFAHPAPLRRWLKFRTDALELGRIAERDRELLRQFEREVSQAESSLRLALRDCGALLEGDATLSGSGLMALAQATVTARDEARAHQRALVEQVQKLERGLVELTAEYERAQSTLAAWQQAYRGSLEALGLSPETTPEVADTALTLLDELRARLDKATSVERERIDTMTRDLAQFNEAVAALASSLGVELTGQDGFELSRQLSLLLQQEERIAEVATNAQTELDTLTVEWEQAEARRSAAEARLLPLYELGGTRDLAQLARAIERSNLVRAIERNRQEAERSILESGDGLTLEALEQEARSVPTALLDERLAQCRSELLVLAERRRTTELEQHEAERALAQIAGQSSAAVTLERRNEALAAMSDGVERFLRLRTSSLLLKWAIERFRREKQGPLLTRAGRLFATLTLGAYQGLLVEYDDQDKPQLLGVSANGKWLRLDAMSAGTTDQLYLALRIAALELHLEGAPALPFIADDLFVHFDDERSEAAFRVLGELAQRTQVLFLTHHPHLVTVAQKALSRAVPVHRLL